MIRQPPRSTLFPSTPLFRSLREDDLAATWVEQFDRWFADAVAAELPEPNAVVVATADADGAPDARIVLMKGYDERSEEHTSELQSRQYLVCRLLLEKKKTT